MIGRRRRGGIQKRDCVGRGVGQLAVYYVDFCLEVCEKSDAFTDSEGVGDGLRRFEEFVYGGKQSPGVVSAGLYNSGVVGGACTVEGVFIELLMLFVGIFMDSETGSIGESFKLAALGFEEV